MFRIFKYLWSELTLPPPPVQPPQPQRQTPVNQTPAPQAPVTQVQPRVVESTPIEAPADRRPGWYPPSFDLSERSAALGRPILFEPALKHFPRAYRHGDPAFGDPERAARWLRRRQTLVDHILQTVSESPWRETLVLRGSTLMKAWFGDRARPPGDIDWVVWPQEYSFQSPEAKRLLDGLLERLRNSPQAGGAVLRADRAVVENIWTYDRAPGRRIVIAWEADGTDQGTIQMDFVFEEPIPDEPETIDYPLADGRTVRLTAAGPEASLIWKLVWLDTDCYAQGKDLFDAVLLTELATPKLDRLHAMLDHADDRPNFKNQLKPDFPLHWSIDWENFQKEYPQVPGTAADWQQKLTDALRPMFEAESE